MDDRTRLGSCSEGWPKVLRAAEGGRRLRLSEVRWQNFRIRLLRLPRNSACPELAICPDWSVTRHILSRDTPVRSPAN